MDEFAVVIVTTIIITFVQSIFKYIYQNGSNWIIYYLNIKYTQEHNDLVALTRILYESFASYLPIFIIAFFVEKPMATLYVLMVQLIFKDMGYSSLIAKWFNQCRENRVLGIYHKMIDREIWKRKREEGMLIQERAERIKFEKEVNRNPLYT